jgi:hypothetical protein
MNNKPPSFNPFNYKTIREAATAVQKHKERIDAYIIQLQVERAAFEEFQYCLEHMAEKEEEHARKQQEEKSKKEAATKALRLGEPDAGATGQA